ncbi:hypothetical protein [Alloalcanivorax xenomutans]|uniref:hypothetical protein n=1 Tax=Alloalcanivorax xenomutans TaxID=1094342 RepID=UPI003BA9799C
MMSIDPWATMLGVFVFFVFFMRFLRVVYVQGKPDPDAISIVWGASFLPAVLTTAVIVAEMLLIRVDPVSGRWVALGQVFTALGGAIWALERGRRQVLQHRMESKDRQ